MPIIKPLLIRSTPPGNDPSTVNPGVPVELLLMVVVVLMVATTLLD
jgi:hypothetical protein